MKNIDKLTRHVALHGPQGILIHSIPKTPYWLVAQNIGPDRWLMTLLNPMGNTTYNLGTINDNNHLDLWTEILTTELNHRLSEALIARDLRNKIKNFKKRYIHPYQNLKANATKKKKNK